MILPEEITHVREGLTWFKHICKVEHNITEEKDIIAKFHETVGRVFRAKLLTPPFDKENRLKAGMTEDYYLPISKDFK